jgi:hypothetical protein
LQGLPADQGSYVLLKDVFISGGIALASFGGKGLDFTWDQSHFGLLPQPLISARYGLRKQEIKIQKTVQ